MDRRNNQHLHPLQVSCQGIGQQLIPKHGSIARIAPQISHGAAQKFTERLTRIGISDQTQIGIKLLDSVGMKSRRMIINRFDYKAVRNSLAPQIDRMIDDTALRLIGIVPYDSALITSSIKGKPIRKGKAYKAFSRIAARLCAKNVRLPKLKRI